MKKIKNYAFVLLITAAVASTFLLITTFFGLHYDKSKTNQKVTISWEEVNIRQNHSANGKIVDVLYKGDTVTLTGYSYEYLGSDGDATESWVEVITNKDHISGWIVSKSVDW